jgi:hypothetical protein
LIASVWTYTKRNTDKTQGGRLKWWFSLGLMKDDKRQEQKKRCEEMNSRSLDCDSSKEMHVVKGVASLG